MRHNRLLAMFLMAVSIVVGGWPEAASATDDRFASISGIGQVTPPGCGQDAYAVPFTMVADGDTWVVARPAAVGAECNSLRYGMPSSFAGSWDSTVGGCIPGLDTFGRLCLGPMPNRGVTNGVSFELCVDATMCWSGQAWLSRL